MIGVRLSDLRKEHNETQKKLATELGVAHYSISDYERDTSEPPDSIKVRIAKHYNVSLDYLLGLTDRMRPIEEGDEYLRLPKGFPAEALAELHEYIAFLVIKYKSKKE